MCRRDPESVDEPRGSVNATPTDAPSAPLASDASSSGDSARGIPNTCGLDWSIDVRGVVVSSSQMLASVLALETELKRGCSETGRYLGSSNSGRPFCVGLRVSSVVGSPVRSVRRSVDELER